MQVGHSELTTIADPKSGSTALQRGIEKESLRVTPSGALSPLPHPKNLGAALTHPNITTDFSEAQLELITGVHTSADNCLAELQRVHQFVYQNLDNEILWPSSMPCLMGNDNSIPIGQYGSSNIGMAKTVYRRGLGVRYGRLMQTISGIHYNFSVPDTLWQTLGVQTQQQVTERYFGLIRNFRRWSWLLLYLFGASPAVCKSFTKNMSHNLQAFDEGSQFLPHATSLRMGPLGYQSSAQSDLNISYNSLDVYAQSMISALTTEYPEYAAHGVTQEGNYIQLNTAIIQIENEFYGTIRPKRPTLAGERPVTALKARGVEYVEVRCVDLNPFLPLGLDAQQIHFLDTFLLLCLLSDSPPDSVDEINSLTANQLAVVEEGRAAGLRLQQDTHTNTTLDSWAGELLAGCRDIAAKLDEAQQHNGYSTALKAQEAKLHNSELTPSAQVLKQMQSEQIPFFRFSMNKAIQHAQDMQATPLKAAELANAQQQVSESFQKQQAIEDADTVPFDEFLKDYIAL